MISKAKPAHERAGDAVALAAAYLANHRSEVPGQFHLRPHGVDVALKAFEVKGNPVVVVAVVDPQNVGVPVVRAHVAVSVARIHVELAVAVDVARGKAVHGVVPGEQVGHFGEGLVSVVAEEAVGPTRVDEVHKTVVVKVVHLRLKEEP